MSDRKFVNLALCLFLSLIATVVSVNYLIDPYDFYGNNVLGVRKTQEIGQLRLSKAIKLEKIKPVSVVMGSSRAEFGFDPDHQYFKKPSYNLATGGSSVYELKRYLEFAIEQGRLEQVLLVADYINFNSNEERKVSDFDEFFGNKNLFSYLFSLSTLKNSYFTWYGERQKKYTIYNKNGQREKTHNSGNLRRFGGQLRKIYSQSTYFEGFDNDNHYRDTRRSSFDDFRAFLQICHDNNISLEIVFGPNHVLHWEAFDYSIGLEKWFDWKKRVVAVTEQVASENGKAPYRVVDFSIYHKYTREKLPEKKSDEMTNHWELNHYKSVLGDRVLDDLINSESSFGIELTSDNIDQHNLVFAEQRKKYVDAAEYRDQLLIGRNRVDLNQFLDYVEFY